MESIEPLALIISALVGGATAALKDGAEKALKDAYAHLKRLILNRYGKTGDVARAVEQLEAKPESTGRQTVVQEELAATDAPRDAEVLRAAQTLLEMVSPGSSPSLTVTASDHSIAIGGSVGGDVTNIHGDGNIVGDHNVSRVKK